MFVCYCVNWLKCWLTQPTWVPKEILYQPLLITFKYGYNPSTGAVPISFPFESALSRTRNNSRPPTKYPVRRIFTFAEEVVGVPGAIITGTAEILATGTTAL